jgi:hypothetical protein
MSDNFTQKEENESYEDNFFKTSLLNAEDQFKFDILMAGQEKDPLHELDQLKYNFHEYLMSRFVRLALDCNGALDIYIKKNPESPTNLEIGVGIRFCHPDAWLCKEFFEFGKTEPNSAIFRYPPYEAETDFRSALDYVYIVTIPNLKACKLLALGFDAIEQEDERIKMGFGTVAGQISVVKALSKKYRFWRGAVELLTYFTEINSKSSNRLTSGVISRPLIYLVFMYFVQNALLTLAYRDTPDQTWQHILGVRDLIVETFKPLNSDTPQTIRDLKDFSFLYGPPFNGDFPTLINLSEYQGKFWNGLSLSNQEEFFQYYEDFFAGKYPTEERPLVFDRLY